LTFTSRYIIYHYCYVAASLLQTPRGLKVQTMQECRDAVKTTDPTADFWSYTYVKKGMLVQNVSYPFSSCQFNHSSIVLSPTNDRFKSKQPCVRIFRPSFRENPKRSFSVIENERFGLVFAKTGSLNSGTGITCPWIFISIMLV
jgi:hypothetical protein